MKNVKKDMFELEGDEVMAVFLKTCLWSSLSWPNHLNDKKDLNHLRVKQICLLKNLVA